VNILGRHGDNYLFSGSVPFGVGVIFGSLQKFLITHLCSSRFSFRRDSFFDSHWFLAPLPVVLTVPHLTAIDSTTLHSPGQLKRRGAFPPIMLAAAVG
jgi:hypothetical protein